jgi:uncharacterized short protein YbdD (DUF466 family)
LTGRLTAWLAATTARLGPRLRLVLGVPDYDRYLRHLRARHPEATPLSRDEFARDCLRRRYDRPGSRCC